MGFIGSYLYYGICAVGLVILVIALMEHLDKDKRPPKNTPPPPYQEPVSQRPRYAAGDDMDRINRNARSVEFGGRRSGAPTIIGIIIVGLLLLTMVPKLKSGATPGAIPATAPAQLAPAGTVDMKVISADFSGDLSKLFVTYRYTNNSDRDVRSLVPTINLLDAEGNTIQTMEADTVDRIAKGETKEIISSIDIQPDNLGKISQVEIHTSYRG